MRIIRIFKIFFFKLFFTLLGFLLGLVLQNYTASKYKSTLYYIRYL